MVLGNGSDAVCTCSILLAYCGDKATWFKQGQECRDVCRHLHGHAYGQVVCVKASMGLDSMTCTKR